MADQQPRISIDLHLRDAASVFAREKQDTCAGPQRESFRRRLLQFVDEYDRLAQGDVPHFEVGPELVLDRVRAVLTAPMEHIITPGLEAFEDRWHFSHVVAARGLLLLSGVTGTSAEGHISEQPATQFDQAFVHLRQYLESAGASLTDVIEMTSYHVDLRRHLDAFVAVKDRYITAPYPAWSAIGVSELITEGALVEIRAIATDPRPRS
jgi:enamine deaminase RidA (YjgF/YER057c/UK114 family)